MVWVMIEKKEGKFRAYPDDDGNLVDHIGIYRGIHEHSGDTNQCMKSTKRQKSCSSSAELQAASDSANASMESWAKSNNEFSDLYAGALGHGGGRAHNPKVQTASMVSPSKDTVRSEVRTELANQDHECDSMMKGRQKFQLEAEAWKEEQQRKNKERTAKAGKHHHELVSDLILAISTAKNNIEAAGRGQIEKNKTLSKAAKAFYGDAVPAEIQKHLTTMVETIKDLEQNM